MTRPCITIDTPLCLHKKSEYVCRYYDLIQTKTTSRTEIVEPIISNAIYQGQVSLTI